MYRGMQKEITYSSDRFGNVSKEEKYVDKKNATIGAIVYIGGWLFSSFEAKSEAKRINNLEVSQSSDGTMILSYDISF